MYENPVYTCFLDVAKFDDVWWKNADARTRRMCHVIYIFFGSYLGKV